MDISISGQLDLDTIPLEGFAIAHNRITLYPTQFSTAASTACSTSRVRSNLESVN